MIGSLRRCCDFLKSQVISFILARYISFSSGHWGHILVSYIIYILLSYCTEENDTQKCFSIRKEKRSLQSVTKYLRLTLVFMESNAPREGFNCYFSGLFW